MWILLRHVTPTKAFFAGRVHRFMEAVLLASLTLRGSWGFFLLALGKLYGSFCG